LSKLKKLFRIDKKTFKEALFGEEYGFEEDDPNRVTTIPIRVRTKMRLRNLMVKGVTYDEAINRLIDLLEQKI